MSITWQELERRFGRGGFKEINRLVGFIGATHWSKDKHYTRGYYLTPEGEAFIEVLLKHQNGDEYLVDEEGKKLVKPKRNGRNRRDMKGNNPAWTIPVPAFCYVNVEEIQCGKKLLQKWRGYYSKLTLIRPETYGPFERLERPFKATETLTQEASA